MSEFSRYHPSVSFLYFSFALFFSCAHFNPISVGISLFAAFFLNALITEKGAFLKRLAGAPILLIMMALINPTFNHRGVTVIAYLPSGNPLTAESVCFGLIASAMLLSVIVWFSSFNEIMTSDKLIYIFGRLIPSLSLIFSMTLRAVPRFKEQFKRVARAQRCIGRGAAEKGLFKRIKSGISIISIMITWSMENAVETADSMKARGFGTKRRTAFSVYTFTSRDKAALSAMLLLGFFAVLGGASGAFDFSCFPYIEGGRLSLFTIPFYAAELCFLAIPIIIEVTERRKWNCLN